MLQTEFPFTLPRGFVDADGTIHSEGVMRLATAQDEVHPFKDPRVRLNERYAVVIVLSRVVTRLGELPAVNPKVIEGLFAADFAYLVDLYRRLNENGHARLTVTCPHCAGIFEVEADDPGG
jgi:hypothetical protein